MPQKPTKSTEKRARWQELRKNLFVRSIAIGLCIVLIFSLGVAVGNGNISFSRSAENGNLPSQLNYSSVNQVYNLIKDNYDGKLTAAQLTDGLKEGLAQATGDPYTEYFNPQQAQAFNNELDGSFAGIGAELGESSANQLEVIAPVADTPAAKAGLKAKDVIISINGKDTSTMSLDTAVGLIRGAAGTKVTLGIIRGSQQLTMTITRAKITVPSVNSKILNGNIGYMQITQFSEDTGGLATQAAKKFVQSHVKGVILDLRDNPGGEVTSAITVSSLWIPEGTTILQEKHGGTVVETDSATGNDILHGIPTVVLINGGSASASEITTGALHDDIQAHVLGTQSYGKGVVQQVFNLSGGSELKVTVASWYRPNGQSINHKGINPDQKVADPTADQVKAGQDPQLSAAEAYLTSAPK